MKILLAVYAKSNTTKNVAFCLQDFFKGHDHTVELEYIEPVKKLKEHEYSKSDSISFKNKVWDVTSFDLIIIGTTVFSFFPSPVVLAYVRKLQGLEGKKAAVYSTCILPGAANKTISNVLSTRGVHVMDTLTVTSLLEINSTKIKTAEQFAERLLATWAHVQP